MKVVIVGRTHMYQGVCIGGVTTDYEAVRLQPAGSHSHPVNAPYQVGDVWEVDFRRHLHLRAPHVEDVVLSGPGRLVDRVDDVGEWLLRGVHPWTGSAANTFNGALRVSETGRARVTADAVPNSSVGFWIPDRPLLHSQFEDRERYTYTDYDGIKWRFSYAGTGPSLRIIPAGMLVRLSLARWWAPPGTTEPEACYAQVSGWFPIDVESDEGSPTLSRRAMQAPPVGR